MENILVVGATGSTGKQVVDLLKSSQYFEPVAMVRKKEQQVPFEAQGVRTVLADLEEDVDHAMKDIDKVVFAAGSGGKKVKAVDQNGAIKVVDAAQKNGIKKFVMLSSMGADQPEKNEELQDYLKAKHQADAHLKQSTLSYVIVRPGQLKHDPGTDKIKLAEKLDDKGSIPRADVAQVLTRSLHDDTMVNQTFEIVEGDTLIGKALDTMETQD